MATTGKGYGVAASAATGKTLSQLQDIAKYHGWSDTSTTGLAQLTHFINHTIQILSTLAPWPEYHRVDGSATFSAADDQETLDETNIIRLGTVVRDDRSSPLDYIELEDWLHKKKYLAASGSPTMYAIRKYTSSGATKLDMHLYPNPSAEITLYYTYQLGPTELSESGDTTDWPNDRIWLLAEALRIRLATINRDVGGVVLYSADFQSKVNTAYNQARPNYMPVIARPLVSVRAGKWSIKDVNRHNSSFL